MKKDCRYMILTDVVSVGLSMSAPCWERASGEAMAAPDFVEGIDGVVVHAQGQDAAGSGGVGACAGHWTDRDFALASLANFPHQVVLVFVRRVVNDIVSNVLLARTLGSRDGASGRGRFGIASRKLEVTALTSFLNLPTCDTESTDME